ncbi:nucleoside triphosphate pyrophosphohydrolase family protein [Halosimplex halophilum]|uniref:hypothetical protein n=1 Tax=Halosimplex halophilum TaxID=2559572 RepID=UPI00107F46E5|nr:hypothetical protein [Halosimplex halophilum]
MRDRKARDDLYERAAEAWGEDAQLTKAAEEFAELAAVVNRAQNGQADHMDIIEELVDARLMLEQLEFQLDDATVGLAFDQAVADLEDRLEVHGDAE